MFYSLEQIWPCIKYRIGDMLFKYSIRKDRKGCKTNVVRGQKKAVVQRLKEKQGKHQVNDKFVLSTSPPELSDSAITNAF